MKNMREESFEFSLDDLKVEEKEVRQPTIFPVSILVSETEFKEPIDNVSEFKEK